MNLALLAAPAPAAATGVQVAAAIVASRMVATEVPLLTLAMMHFGMGSYAFCPLFFGLFDLYPSTVLHKKLLKK